MEEEAKQPTIDEMVEKEMQKTKNREAAVEKRVANLDCIHEDIVIINRLGNLEALTFLEMTEKSIISRQRSSWYGKVLAVSPVDSADSVRTHKKTLLKPGDIVSFNPDSAYSLNVANFDEIWTLHIDNVLIRDNEYDYLAAQKENLSKKFEIQQRMAQRQFAEAQARKDVTQIHRNLQKPKA